MRWLFPAGMLALIWLWVNGALHGFEIKSNADSLSRLQAQSRAYGLIFDFVNLVRGTRHDKVTSLIPDWWGVYEAVDTGRAVKLEKQRDASENPSVDPGLLIRLLWRSEVENLLRLCGAEGINSKLKAYEVDRLALETVPADEMKHYVRETLKKRPNLGDFDAIRT